MALFPNVILQMPPIHFAVDCRLFQARKLELHRIKWERKRSERELKQRRERARAAAAAHAAAAANSASAPSGGGGAAGGFPDNIFEQMFDEDLKQAYSVSKMTTVVPKMRLPLSQSATVRTYRLMSPERKLSIRAEIFCTWGLLRFKCVPASALAFFSCAGAFVKLRITFLTPPEHRFS